MCLLIALTACQPNDTTVNTTRAPAQQTTTTQPAPPSTEALTTTSTTETPDSPRGETITVTERITITIKDPEE